MPDTDLGMRSTSVNKNDQLCLGELPGRLEGSRGKTSSKVNKEFRIMTI